MPSRKSPVELFEEGQRVNICAPMVRYSKLPFRELVRNYNVDLCYTPMILADVFKSSTYARDSDFTTNERDDPVIIQFAANNAKDLVEAAELAAPYVNGIDINCGCPQKWALQEHIGAFLMTEPETVRDMVHSVKAHVDIPCSVKIRIHPDLKETYEFVKRAEAAGADFITVHGRTRKQKSSEPVNLDAIRFVKEVASVPVVANGDVFSLTEAEDVFDKTGVNGVMAARGILQNPALFAGDKHTPWECIERYIKLALGYGTNTFIFHHHLMYMFEDVMSNAERKTFNCLSSVPAILDHLEKYWDLDVARVMA
ncbi:hypothetical protein BC938DRAFT_481429 [Jimgerdemannia flammicorona]|uniref:tRNA-dihydrouridine synthase n=1 Tax=Jimgerdemannia flammicorona TaxID=994334 RepID=A0A433QX21_9FUNG|nr:hypothetical protein BC938DRAFT_481429 [Jimgerdemannia flammicorona]